jgi:hypothetical protein
MAAFFVLFPRVQGPLWALPSDARSGISGLSDSMAPGSLSNLIKSDALAFRVAFEGERPPYSAMYWRGPVLADFDGVAWKMFTYGQAGDLRYARAENPVRYTVTLEPSNKNWLFALDVPAAAPRGSYPLADLQLRSHRPVDQRLRYDMRSYLDYKYGEQMGPVQQRWYLRFDESRNPRAVALGRQWARELQATARHPVARDPALQPRVHLHARAAAARLVATLRRFPLQLEARLLRALRRQLRAADARRGNPVARRHRLPGRRGEPLQPRAHRAAGRRACVDRDLGEGRGLGARRSHRRRSRRCGWRAA